MPGWRGLVLAAYVWLYFDVTGIWPLAGLSSQPPGSPGCLGERSLVTRRPSHCHQPGAQSALGCHSQLTSTQHQHFSDILHQRPGWPPADPGASWGQGNSAVQCLQWINLSLPSFFCFYIQPIDPGWQFTQSNDSWLEQSSDSWLSICRIQKILETRNDLCG